MLLQMASFHSFYGWVVFHCVCVYIYMYVHTTSSSFIHLMMDTEVTPSLVIVNGATLNTGVHCLIPWSVLNGCYLGHFQDKADETLRAAAPPLVFEWASVFENELETSNLLCSLWHQQTDRQADGQPASLWLSPRFIWRSLWLTLLKSHT